MDKRTNKLRDEKSPYLLQHSENPVEWYPWGEEAFEKAVREDKPIFLSIGYSTCHWCHVMAHECFEDEQVAALMNETFVSVKVDREERPDIDSVYMNVCQLMTGGGGWPLTIVMTPHKKPFFAATYIPKTGRFGRPGMLDLVPTLARMWSDKRDEVHRVAEGALKALQERKIDMNGDEVPGELAARQARRILGRMFDEQFGGFGNAPKFPSVPYLLFLLRFWKREDDGDALQMVKKTLTAMRMGGIYDHVGFGFHRYSTDQNWLVPHFEKMLYDQALLLMAYTEAYQATGDEEYGVTAREITSYVVRELTSGEGGFACAVDADSEGEEGRFYLWEFGDLEAALTDEELDLAVKLFGVERGGNYYDEAARSRTGRNILHIKAPLREAARNMHASLEELECNVAAWRAKLFRLREGRPKPHLDDKILTDWNGLMIAALAVYSRVFDDREALDASRRACAFIIDKLGVEGGRLLHRYRDGESAIPGALDDYAFLIWGLIELYETTFEGSYLQTAVELTDTVIRRFWDEESGGLYLTADDSEDILVRRKELYDGVVPSGNSVMLLNLLKLAGMSGGEKPAERARRLARSFNETVRKNPAAYAFFLLACDMLSGGGCRVVIVGRRGDPDTERMIGVLRSGYRPDMSVILKERENDLSLPPETRTFLKSHARRDGKATCYVCENLECFPPLTDAERIPPILERGRRPPVR